MANSEFLMGSPAIKNLVSRGARFENLKETELKLVLDLPSFSGGFWDVEQHTSNPEYILSYFTHLLLDGHSLHGRYWWFFPTNGPVLDPHTSTERNIQYLLATEIKDFLYFFLFLWISKQRGYKYFCNEPGNIGGLHSQPGHPSGFIL